MSSDVGLSETDGYGIGYRVEVVDGAEGSILHAESVARSSYRLPASEGRLFWRVTAETP